MNKTIEFKLNKNFIPFVIILLFSSIPWIDFINSNINEKEFILTYNYLLYFFINFLILFIIFKLLSLFSNINSVYLSGYISFIFWLFFQHETIKREFESLSYINYDFLNLSFYLSFYLILIFTIISYFLIKKKFFNYFLLFFLFLNLISSSYLFLKNNISYKQKSVSLENKITSNNSPKSNKNVYFILIDTMMPIPTFEKYALKSYENLENFKKDFKAYGYNYYPNTVNNYGSTPESLATIFNLSAKLEEKISDNGEKKVVWFPEILTKKYNTPLIRELSKINYDLKWLGNSWADCLKFNISLCIRDDKTFYLDTYLLNVFLSKSPFKKVFVDNFKFFNPDGYFNVFEKKDNALGNFKEITYNSEINDKSTFYFIHNIYPHHPYIYDENCNRQDPGRLEDFEKFKNTYLCVTKQIIDFIKYLEKKDKNALVVFQADHNWPYFGTGNFDKTELEEKNRIFNLVKGNIKCGLDIPENFNNLRTIKYILKCLNSNEKI